MPDWSSEIRRRLATLRIEPAGEASVVEEISQHLDDRYAELLASGASPDAAHAAALEELDRPAIAAVLRDALPRPGTSPAPPPEPETGRLSGLGADLRYGLRRLRLDPGFAAVAILSLALGVGANAAIFQLVDAVRLRRLPIRDPQTLLNLRIAPSKGRSGNFSGRRPQLTFALWDRIRQEQKAFSELAVWCAESITLSSGGEARSAEALWVSGTFFETLGVAPLRGRLLGPADDAPGCASPAVVLSEPFWRREFGGREIAPGETISIAGRPFEVAGVTPARFFGVEIGRSFDVALPVCAENLLAGSPRTKVRHAWWLSAIGRLEPGWTPDRANSHLAAISPGIFEATLPDVYDAEDVEHYRAMKLEAVPAATGFSDLREDYGDPLWVLLGLSGLVLLIACANVANLMVARASARQREIAVRLALGASRRRLVQQLLAESLLLAIAGAAGGAGLARVLSRLLVALLDTSETRWFVAMPLDLRLFAFTAGLATVTCVLFGLLPALQASRTDPIEAMKAGSRGVAGARLSARRSLVVAQLALALVLLVGSLLFVRSLRNLLTVDVGFAKDHLLVVDLDYSRLHVPVERRLELRRRLLERVRAVPGSTAVAGVRFAPLGNYGWNEYVSVEGTDVRRKSANFNQVSPGYFRTVGTALLAGREFDDNDRVGAEPVAIVTEAFARTFLAGQNPIGRSFQLDNQGGDTARRVRIVGLVRDTKYARLREDFAPIVYRPQAQDDDPRSWSALVIRTDLPLSALRRPILEAVAGVDPGIDVSFSVFREMLDDHLVSERLMAKLSSSFGLLAAVLATIGLYGVVSFIVVRRRNEIGVRMALGATRGDILGLVLREAGLLLSVGIAIGVALAIAAATLAKSLLFGLAPSDPVTIAAASAGLAAVAIAASLVPARRAAALDPVAALRDE